MEYVIANILASAILKLNLKQKQRYIKYPYLFFAGIETPYT